MECGERAISGSLEQESGGEASVGSRGLPQVRPKYVKVKTENPQLRLAMVQCVGLVMRSRLQIFAF